MRVGRGPRIVINSPQPRDVKRSERFVVVNFILKNNVIKASNRAIVRMCSGQKIMINPGLLT